MLIEEKKGKPVALVSLCSAVVLIGPARAQSGDWGDGHAANHDWYRTLKTKSGWSCCSGDQGHGDCRPVQAHQRQDGDWEAYFNGSWQEIPPDAILRDDLNRFHCMRISVSARASSTASCGVAAAPETHRMVSRCDRLLARAAGSREARQRALPPSRNLISARD